TVSGSWLVIIGATFTAANSLVQFTATSTGETITTGGSAFYNLIFNGSTGDCGAGHTDNGDGTCTAKLQGAGTENLADTMLYQGEGDTNYGSDIYFFVRGLTTYNHRGILKFELSSIPNNSTINSAALYLYQRGTAYTGTHNIGAHFVSDDSWVESTTTWNNQPSHNGTAMDTIDVDNTGGAAWYNWNITDQTQTEYGDNQKISIKMVSQLEGGGTNRQRSFHTKEYTTDESLRPYLNATYTVSSGGWTFAANDHDVNNNFTITAGSVTSTSGTLYVGGNWSNLATFNHGGGTV
ncbi:unnamed protein product, partial [marine sediment metagenome]